MTKTVWVVEGIGDDNPRKEVLGPSETVNSFKDRYARKLGLNSSEIELATDTARLTNGEAPLIKMVNDGDTLHVTPRAKAGAL